MDKRSLLAFVLIGLIVTGWLVWVSTTQEEAPAIKSNEKTTKSKTELDSNINTEKKDDSTESTIATSDSLVKSTNNHPNLNNYGELFAKFAEGTQELYTIETDLYKAIISTKGFVIKKWYLKKYKSWNQFPVQLINNSTGELALKFTSIEGKRIDSRNLHFRKIQNYPSKSKIKPGDSISFVGRLEIEPGKFIEKKFTFYGNKYIVGTAISFNNMDSYVPTRGYDISWSSGLRYQEKNTVEESNSSESIISMNGEIESLNADESKPTEGSYTGIIDYVGTKSKYFGVAIIPEPYRSFDGTADLSGTKRTVREDGYVESYDISIRVPYKGGLQTNNYNVFIGPLDYDLVSNYHLEEMVDFGWRIIIRPIGEYFMLPIFTFIHSFIPNFGISIILFSILMKILLHPLSIQQMKSAQKMQLLGPELSKLREQYKDDPQKQQKETMALYSTYGINPMGGCLPLLLQMPILYALWSVLRTSIVLRQADFALWINDLSAPDFIFDLGFSFIGIRYISGLALLMGVTMFFQQKLTITDPRQKAMVYMMPVMFTIMFSYFPSGLNLYYFVFNVLGIAQQIYLNKFAKNRLTLADLKKLPKKEGWLQKKMREAQQIAESRGQSLPGQSSSSSKTKNQRKKK